MNKKGFADSLVEKVLWIIFFIMILIVTYKLFDRLTG